MAALTVTNPALTGTAPTSASAGASGDTITPTDATEPLYIRVTNANGSTVRTITVDDPNSVGPANAKAFNADVDIAVAASSTRVVKIAKPSRFVNSATGAISLSYSSNADLTIEVYQ